MASLPVLVDRSAGLRLRPWHPAEAAVLVEAWATPDIAGRARAGADRSLEGAARWIRGAAARASAGLAIDLVIAPLDGTAVWGEVGLVRRRLRSSGGSSLERTVWEVGWWVLPAERGRGRAARAVTRLGTWAGPALGVEAWVARIEPGNVASARVAEAVGLTRRGGFDAGRDLWAGPLPGGGPRADDGRQV